MKIIKTISVLFLVFCLGHWRGYESGQYETTLALSHLISEADDNSMVNLNLNGQEYVYLDIMCKCGNEILLGFPPCDLWPLEFTCSKCGIKYTISKK